MTTELEDAKAALGRLAMGANYAHDVHLIRVALDQLAARSSLPADDAERRETFNAMRHLDDEIHGTPPADDVREALVSLIWGDADAIESLSVEGAADRILSDSRFEVRLRGTVTEPTDAAREALLAVRDEIIRNEGRADAACLATLEAIASGAFPRGTATDAEAEWEYVPGEIWTDRFGGKHVAVQSGVIAPGYVDTYIAEGGDVLRRKVGPWETVTADTAREARS